MPLLNTADKLYVGSSLVDKIFRGLNIVWEPDVVGGPPNTQIVQVTSGYTTNGVYTDTFDAAPNPNALVLGVVSTNKDALVFTTPTNFAKHAEYAATNVSGAVASARGVNGGTWSWTGQKEAFAAFFEFNLTDWSFRDKLTVPDPENDNNVTSISGDIGTAPAPGVVFAIVGVDSSWNNNGPFEDTGTITWSNGFQQIGRFQGDVEATHLAAGAAFIIAKKDVDTGDSCVVQASWTGTPADQAYMHVVRFDSSSGSPGGGSPTLLGTAARNGPAGDGDTPLLLTPATTSIGDTVIAIQHLNFEELTSFNPPTGDISDWTLIGRFKGGNSLVAAWLGHASVSGANDVQFANATTSSSFAIIHTYEGSVVVNGTPSTAGAASVSGGSMVIPGVTTTGPARLIGAWTGLDFDAGTGIVDMDKPASMTGEVTSRDTSGSDVVLITAYEDVTTGATGSRTATVLNGHDLNAGWTGILFALVNG